MNSRSEPIRSSFNAYSISSPFQSRMAWGTVYWTSNRAGPVNPVRLKISPRAPEELAAQLRDRTDCHPFDSQILALDQAGEAGDVDRAVDLFNHFVTKFD